MNTTIIDWGSAPKGATHYGQRTETSLEGWFKITDEGYQFISKNSDGGWLGGGTQGFGPRGYIPLTPRPTYAEEMSSMGVEPYIGMKFETEAGEYYVEHVNDKSVCFTDKDGFYVGIPIGHIRPIRTETETEKAIINLMFYGDQQQTEERASLTLDAIKAGKIHGVRWVK